MEEGAKTDDTFIYAETTSCGMCCRILRDVIGKREKIIESGWRSSWNYECNLPWEQITIDPFHDIERQIGYLRVEVDDESDQGLNLLDLIESSITETLLMHLKKTWTNISELF